MGDTAGNPPGTNKHGVTADQVFWWDPPVKTEGLGFFDYLKQYFGYCFDNYLRADYTGFTAQGVVFLFSWCLLFICEILFILTFWTIIGFIVFLILIIILCIIIFVELVLMIILFFAAFISKGMSTPSDKVTAPQSGPVSGHDWFRPPVDASFGQIFSYCNAQLLRADHCGLVCWLLYTNAFTVIYVIASIVIYILIMILSFLGIGIVILIIYVCVCLPLTIVYLALHILLFIDFVAAIATGGPSVISKRAESTPA